SPISWAPDGKSIAFTQQATPHFGDGDQSMEMVLDVASGESRKLTQHKAFEGYGTYSPDGSRIAYWYPRDGDPNNVNEIFVASASAPPRRLTDLNAEIASRQLGAVERFEWQGPNGFRDDGVVIYPPGFSKGKKYPLVLIIHGGPTAASVRTFSLFSQAVAAHDYIVFSPNYRGSDNLGNAYQRAIFNDAGDGPGRDVMAGIAALARMGSVDTTRI